LRDFGGFGFDLATKGEIQKRESMKRRKSNKSLVLSYGERKIKSERVQCKVCEVDFCL